MSDMIDLQRAIVADHIADLEREGAALRAERVRDDRDRDASSAPLHAPSHRPPRRVRLGQWLVAIGEAIAGPAASAATLDSADQTSGDGPRGLSHAA